MSAGMPVAFGRRAAVVSAGSRRDAPAAPPSIDKDDTGDTGGGGGKNNNNDHGPIREAVFDALMESIDPAQLAALEGSAARREIGEAVHAIVAARGLALSVAEQERLLSDICDSVLGHGPLEPLLARSDITDIMVNGSDSVFIETGGKVSRTPVHFRDNAQLMNVCRRIVARVGRRIDESAPVCDARLPDGSRVNVIAPPLALDGPILTIRKFRRDRLTMDALTSLGAVSPEGARLLEIIGRVRCNVVISGGTGSGKTTLLNCMTGFIEPDERIITCEDTAELQLQQPHVVRLETRPANLEGAGEVTMRDLVRNCLRMRPDRIIIGEVRGAEAFDLLQAMNTGHDGSMGTLHANSPREALSRLESMITMGGYALPAGTIRKMISESIDVIIQAARLRDGSRRIVRITEVLGMESGTITTQDLLVHTVTGEEDGRLTGVHRGTGVVRPALWERAQYYRCSRALSEALHAAQPKA